MNHPGQKDWARVSESIRELYAQVTFEGLRKRILDELLLLVPCDYGSYNEFDFRQGKSVVHLAADAPEITRLLPVLQLHIAQDPHVTYTEWTADCSAR
jgi:hypothetical protein